MQNLLIYSWDLVRRFLKSESKIVLEEAERNGTEFSKGRTNGAHKTRQHLKHIYSWVSTWLAAL
jgi:hypothetical protein